jgi:hypothetical protein
MKSFIPTVIALLRAWLLNLKTVVPVQGLLVGQTGPQNTATAANAQQGMDLIDALANAKAAQKAAVTALNLWKKPGGTGLAVIRKSIANMKTDPGYTGAIGDILQSVGGEEDFDAIDFKPVGEAIHQPGYNLIEFFKHGVESMLIEYRVKGTVDWIDLGRVTQTGFHHVYTLPVVVPPISPAPTSVLLEYRLTGVMHDVLIGHESDLFECNFVF